MPENRFQKFTAFVRSRWQTFNQKYPRLSWAALVGVIGSFLLVFSVCLFIFLTYKGAFGAIPTYGELQNIQNNTASEVYSEDEVLLGKYYIENRVNAEYDELSEHLINALVATEDARFFEHRGVDFRATLRVVFKTVLMGDRSAGGGSTLSQQLAKNLYGRRGSGIVAMASTKFKEMFIARRLEKIYTKKELLNLYLNTVPFGDDIYGVKVAAQRFFNVSPADLTVEDAAALVGMLKANTYYNPVRNPAHATERRNTVMAQMVKYNYLTRAEADSLQQLPITVKYSREGHNQGTATYFREHLRGELKDIVGEIEKPNGQPYNIYTDGLKIFTTINSDFQRYAEEAVREHLSKLQPEFDKDKTFGKDSDLVENVIKKSVRYERLKKAGKTEAEIKENFDTPVRMTVFAWNEDGEETREMSPRDSIAYYLGILRAGFMVMQPQTGKIQAWVGGADQKYFQYDHVKGTRQVGSTFKPLVYAEALRQGYTPCEYLYNRLVTYTEYQDWTPENSDGKYGGLYSMKGGLANSVNAVTVDMMMRVGVDSVRALAQELGIENDVPALPSIALGAADLSLGEMVLAYATFANNGVRPEPYYLTRIENSRGEIIWSADTPDPKDFAEVLTKEDNALLTNMLEAVVDSGTARRIRYQFNLPNDIAGKTGTTQDQGDGWFMGYTPVFAAGAWVGAEYPTTHWRSLAKGQGAATALPIWGLFAKKMYADPKYKKLQRATFYPLTPEQQLDIACPMYLESEDMLQDSTDFEPKEPTMNDRLRDLFNIEKRTREEGQRRREAKRSAEQRENSRKIRERNEALRRKREKEKNKKKKKPFFKRIFKNQQ